MRGKDEKKPPETAKSDSAEVEISNWEMKMKNLKFTNCTALARYVFQQPARDGLHNPVSEASAG